MVEYSAVVFSQYTKQLYPCLLQHLIYRLFLTQLSSFPFFTFCLQSPGISASNACGRAHTEHYDRNISKGRRKFIEDILCFAIA